MENKNYEVESNGHIIQIVENKGEEETFYQYYDCDFDYCE